MSRKIEKKTRDEISKNGEISNFERSVLGCIDEFFLQPKAFERLTRRDLTEHAKRKNRKIFEILAIFSEFWSVRSRT